MQNLPIARMFLFSMACSALTAGVGLGVCLLTDANMFLTALAMLVPLVGVGFFVLRWWSKACRSAGVEARAEMSPARWRLLAFYLATIAVAFGASLFAFRLTHNRIIEVVIALVIAAPAAAVVLRAGYEMQGAPKPSESQLLALNSRMFAILPLILAANAVLFVNERHTYPELLYFQEALVAFTCAFVPFGLINAYFARNRYLLARSLIKAS